jgi:hypothetical protein
MEIFGAIIGFLGSLVPFGFKYVQDKSDKKHELKILELQSQIQKENSNQKLNEINVNADISESKSLYKTFYSKIKWIDALNGTVRPVIVYCFFALYVYTKISYLTYTDVFIMGEFWTKTDNTIFLTMIAFYYGQRSMQKILK